MSARPLLVALGICIVAAPAAAHHGFGRFDPTKDVTLEGTLTGIDFVNPHAYLYFDAVAGDGKVTPMRCEMRAATVLRRSGHDKKKAADLLGLSLSSLYRKMNELGIELA